MPGCIAEPERGLGAGIFGGVNRGGQISSGMAVKARNHAPDSAKGRAERRLLISSSGASSGKFRKRGCILEQCVERPGVFFPFA